MIILTLTIVIMTVMIITLIKRDDDYLNECHYIGKNKIKINNYNTNDINYNNITTTINNSNNNNNNNKHIDAKVVSLLTTITQIIIRLIIAILIRATIRKI